VTRAVLLLLAALLAAVPVWAGEAVAIRAAAIALNPDAPDQTVVGRLRLRAALDLRAEHAAFGGWSGLEILPGNRLLAVSDQGHWLAASLVFDRTGRLTGLDRATIEPLRQPDGRASASKLDNDAESLRLDRDGSLLVGFEQRHRVLRYPLDADGMPGVPTPVAVPVSVRQQPRNGGLEALAVLAGGELAMFSEDLRDKAGNAVGWLRDGNGAWHWIFLRIPEPLKPVDAAILPDGDLLVLERRFSLLGGPGMRLVRIARRDIAPGAVLEGETLADLAPPLAVDNFEALAVARDAAGRTLLYVLSDDNFSSLQRTLLLQFELTD
jgi:hypothetical protein